jgi:acetyl esterase/lipase
MTARLSRRDCLRFCGASAGASLAAALVQPSRGQDAPLKGLGKSAKDLTIKEFRSTPRE